MNSHTELTQDNRSSAIRFSTIFIAIKDVTQFGDVLAKLLRDCVVDLSKQSNPYLQDMSLIKFKTKMRFQVSRNLDWHMSIWLQMTAIQACVDLQLSEQHKINLVKTLLEQPEFFIKDKKNSLAIIGVKDSYLTIFHAVIKHLKNDKLLEAVLDRLNQACATDSADKVNEMNELFNLDFGGHTVKGLAMQSDNIAMESVYTTFFEQFSPRVQVPSSPAPSAKPVASLYGLFTNKDGSVLHIPWRIETFRSFRKL